MSSPQSPLAVKSKMASCQSNSAVGVSSTNQSLTPKERDGDGGHVQLWSCHKLWLGFHSHHQTLLSLDYHPQRHFILEPSLSPARYYHALTLKVRRMACLKTTRGLVLLVVVLLHGLPAANAFFSVTSAGRLSTGTLRSAAAVSSTTPHHHHHQYQQQKREINRRRGGASSLEAIGVTSRAIETVAKGILNLALANPKQATVECTISSSAMDLVRGNLERAKIDG